MLRSNFFGGLMAASLMWGVLCATPVGAVPRIPDHPRVNQVNQRFQNQGARIRQGVRSGTLTHGEAQQLRSGDRSIKQEEHTMRSEDNGHLTGADQKSLNQQLNTQSKDIYQEKHEAPPPSPTNP